MPGQEMNFKHKVRGETIRFFNADESEQFEPFRSLGKQSFRYIGRTFDKDRYLRQKVMKGFLQLIRGRRLL